MEMIMIEKRVYDSMVARIETLANKVATLNEQREKRMKHWLDSEEVCEILGIEKRTLQVYRDKGLIPFTRIKHKFFYKPEDISRFLESNYHPQKNMP